MALQTGNVMIVTYPETNAIYFISVLTVITHNIGSNTSIISSVMIALDSKPSVAFSWG